MPIGPQVLEKYTSICTSVSNCKIFIEHVLHPGH